MTNEEKELMRRLVAAAAKSGCGQCHGTGLTRSMEAKLCYCVIRKLERLGTSMDSANTPETVNPTTSPPLPSSEAL